eukprot:scaffold40946_cov472-Skeletonema_dohrnii-CCMP3373.AAC.1
MSAYKRPLPNQNTESLHSSRCRFMKRIDIHVVIGGREKISLSVSSFKLSYLLLYDLVSCRCRFEMLHNII